ncbi:MAG TPA: glycosyltransferase family 4 protein [Terracidiphilus sp.]|jgi:glycosyltransferase involved in cell wall biosynthesis|nr:glycosyltransferase family 4 protein [Terracidiphilus sp.]
MSTFNKKRILYVNHTGLVSGAEVVLLNLLRGLDRDRYEPIVLSPMQGSLGAELLKLEVEWHPITEINTRFTVRPGRILRFFGQLARTVAAIRKRIHSVSPAIVHANSIRAGIAASIAAIGTGKPVIWHVHDTLPRHPASAAIRAFVLLAPKTRVIAVSEATAQAFRGPMKRSKKVRTIYNGVDLEKFRTPHPAALRFRTQLGISESDFLVCAVGQICARKGLRELVEAFRQMQAQAPRMHLAIVGKVVFRHEEEYLQALQRDVQVSGAAGRIHFTGEFRDVSPVLQASNLLVLNSSDEPFGLVLVEAMASETPVLASRVGGIPEIVTDTENGWLIQPGDTSALASKLLALSHDPISLQRAAENAQRTTCPRFSLERFQSEIAAYYSQLAGDTDPKKWQSQVRPALIRTGSN